MKVVAALDSFKGSMTSVEAGNAVAAGIARADSKAIVKVCALADGGEGTLAVVETLGGMKHSVKVSGPLGEVVMADYYTIHDGSMAVIEIAQAAGLDLVPLKDRNPYFTTTYGVGELILHAAMSGCREFIIAVGGSSTNDGGIGMLQALGYVFMDDNMKPVKPGAIGVGNVAVIDESNVNPVIRQCKFHAACDVTSPLYGKYGCSLVYGQQKGADAEMIAQMDMWMRHYDEVVRTYNDADAFCPGAGAAGGVGYALKTFLGAEYESGAEIVIRMTGLESYIQSSDYVVTGEGRIDGQTAMGKAPIAVARLAAKYNKPVIAFSGCVTDDARYCNGQGIDAYFPILRDIISWDEAMNGSSAVKNLSDTAEQVFRLIKRIR